jgi:hypothetical protein
MPELVVIQTEHYDFVVWSKDINSSQERLEKTLGSRGKTSSPSHILLSPPVIIKDSVEPIYEYDIGQTVFFENNQYDIEFCFSESLKDTFQEQQPIIEHRLRTVEESFHYSSRSHSLRATVNMGNDIGWFRFELVYQIGRKQLRQSFAFEILPTKMDMATDLKLINAAIDEQFPLWRFSIAEKTQQNMQAVKKPHPQFLLLWLTQFEALLDDMRSGLRHIINAPHGRLLSTSRSVKINELKGKLSHKLEQDIIHAKVDGDFHRRFPLDKKKLSVDTPENRFIKFVISTSVTKLLKINHAAQKMGNKPDKHRLSNSFLSKLDQWQQDMCYFQRHPLFREIGNFKGLRKESLVLQQKTGYSKVYKVWQQLKCYLELLEGDSNLSLRSISELYEIWCFLEVRRILSELGFKEVVNNRIPMLNNDVAVSFKDGMKGSFKFSRKDGVSLRLAHEPKFLPGGKEIKSWITTQKPDIFLEASFPDGKKIVWLFDAKYRIAEKQIESSSDNVPDEAINQMHRYRDALIHQKVDKEVDTIKTRPVFGAYALYPGFFDQHNEENPYAKAIYEVGIGAFSLLPSTDHSGSIWLTNFLMEKLAMTSPTDAKASSEKYFVEEAPRIPYYGTKIARYNDLVIAANQLGPGRKHNYIENFRLGQANFYHTKQLAFERQRIEYHVVKEAQYIAIAIDSSDSTTREICFIYPILYAKRVRRGDITIDQSGTNRISDPDELYWLFELGQSFKLKQKVTFETENSFRLKLIGREDLSGDKQWNRLSERYTASLREEVS